jgi:hypothetical protein
MGRVWKRIMAAAEHHAARGIALSESEAREIALAIAHDEGIEPPDDVLAYHAYALARRTWP